ncbi:MAG: tetratricopeptide repeat protein, partial [Anaerolineales bacterium]
WDWAAAHKRVNRLAGAMDGLCHFLFRQARYEEGEIVCRIAMETLEKQAAREEPLFYIRVMAWRGWFNLRQAKPELADLYLEGSLALLERSALDTADAKSERAFILMLLGARYLGYSKEVEKGKKLVQQSLRLYNELDEQWWDIGSIDALGSYVWYDIDLPDIESFLKKSIQSKRARGDLFGVAELLEELGLYTLNHKCDPERAEHFLRESSEILQDFNDRVSITKRKNILDHIFTVNGMFPELLELRNHQLYLWEAIGDRSNAGFAQALIGESYHMLGDYEAAERFGRRALITLKDNDVGHKTAFSHWFLGLTLLSLTKYSEARDYFMDSKAIYQRKGFKPGVGCTLATLGRAEIGLGNPIGAWEYAREALALLVEFPVFLWVLYAVSTIAFLFVDKGEVLKAIELYALVSKQPFVANSIWFEDVYGRHIETAAANLPLGDVEAAQARGRALDLMDTARELLAEI